MVMRMGDSSNSNNASMSSAITRLAATLAVLVIMTAAPPAQAFSPLRRIAMMRPAAISATTKTTTTSGTTEPHPPETPPPLDLFMSADDDDDDADDGTTPFFLRNQAEEAAAADVPAPKIIVQKPAPPVAVVVVKKKEDPADFWLGFTVAELKDELRERELSVSGKNKRALVDRLLESDILLKQMERDKLQRAAIAVGTKIVNGSVKPLLGMEIEHGVQSSAIKGAAATAAAVAALASKGVVCGAAAGVGAAYIAISPGDAGNVMRWVGEQAYKTAEVAFGIAKKIDPDQKLLGNFFNNLVEGARKNQERMARKQEEMAEQKRLELEVQEALAAAEIALIVEEKAQAKRQKQKSELTSRALLAKRFEMVAAEKTRVLEKLAEKEAVKARVAEEARLAEEDRRFEEAKAAEDKRLAAEAIVAEKERAARRAEADRAKARRVEIARKVKEAEIRLAEEARVAAEARAAEASRAEARRVANAKAAKEAEVAAEAKRVAEEAKRAEEARAAAETKRIAEEARLAEASRAEARRAEKRKQAEVAAEAERVAEEARAAAKASRAEAKRAEKAKTAADAKLAKEARRAVELADQEREKKATTKDSSVFDEVDFSEAEWKDSIQAAQESIDETIVGIDDAVVSDSAKATWEAAENLAQGLREPAAEFDMEALAKAAREAVNVFEQEMDSEQDEKSSQRAKWDSEIYKEPTKEEDLAELARAARGKPTQNWASLTVPKLKKELLSRGLQATGKKAILVAALEESDLIVRSPVDTEDEDAPLASADDMEEIARAARAAVEQFEGDEAAADDLNLDFSDLDMEELGKAAREAVKMFEAEDEPSDEVLWELENEQEELLAPPSPSTDAAKTDFAGMKVTELKDELKKRGLPMGGKKADLIERLKAL